MSSANSTSSSTAFPKLFLGDHCPHSHELWRRFAKQLSACPAVYVFNRQDKNRKRQQETLLAIRYHAIKQFPTLLFADGTRLESKVQIERDLMDSIEVVNEKPLIPRFQDQCKDEATPRAKATVSNGLNPDGSVNLADRNVQQSLLGDWPSNDDRQQQAQQQSQCSGYGQYQEQVAAPPTPAPQMQAPSGGGQVQAMNASTVQLKPGMQEGIGTSADVDTSAAGAGSSTMLGSTCSPSNDQEFESIGDWPTARKVNGLTGRGNQNIDTHAFLSNRSVQNQSMQNINMDLGQVVSEPVQGY